MKTATEKYPKIPKDLMEAIEKRFTAAAETDKQFAVCNEIFHRERILSEKLKNIKLEGETAEDLVTLGDRRSRLKREISLNQLVLGGKEKRLQALRSDEMAVAEDIREKLDEAFFDLVRKSREDHGPLFHEAWDGLRSARNVGQGVEFLSKLKEAFSFKFKFFG